MTTKQLHAYNTMLPFRRRADRKTYTPLRRIQGHHLCPVCNNADGADTGRRAASGAAIRTPCLSCWTD